MFTLSEKNRGIKVAWFFMIITVGSFLNNLVQVLENDSGSSYEAGYLLGSKLGLITILAVGIILYRRTKRRKFNKSVWGPKAIDYILVFILVVNFIFPFLSGRWVDGTSDDVMSFFYVVASLAAYTYATVAKTQTVKK